MAQFFATVGDFITTVYRYITQLLQGILALPTLFNQFGDFFNSVFPYIPVEIAMFCLLIVGICLLFHIIGR